MEADGLRWSLLVIGSFVIVGLAVHGIWISRKNNEKKANSSPHKNDQQYQPSGWQPDNDNFDEEVNELDDDTDQEVDIKFALGVDENAPELSEVTPTENDYDDLGLGAVRVVSSESKVDADNNAEPIRTADTQEEPEVSSSKIYASVVTQPKPEYAANYGSPTAEYVTTSTQESATHISESRKVAPHQPTGGANSSFSANSNYQVPEPPPFLLRKDAPELDSTDQATGVNNNPIKANPLVDAEQKQAEEKPDTSLTEKPSLSEQARNLVKRKKADSVKKRREPKMAEDQMRIDFDDHPIAESVPKEELKAKSVQPEQQQEVLVLNVKSAEDDPISGAALLPMLLTLGFKFGDQDIFHRHVNSNGKGPVLFSLANMFKPGNFDIDNLENFTTQGISLFMILPIEGEPHQVFNMMHNAARKIADEFSAQIYDARRTLLTKQSLQQYVEKIREFERQRLLRS